MVLMVSTDGRESFDHEVSPNLLALVGLVWLRIVPPVVAQTRDRRVSRVTPKRPSRGAVVVLFVAT